MNVFQPLLVALVVLIPLANVSGQVVPKNLRGTSTAERKGTHDANDMRTEFWNFGMVGNYPPDPLNVDLTTFHSVEVPKGSGVNYSDGTTPFVLAQIDLGGGTPIYIMETGYRERQAQRLNGQMMRFEPRPGYFQANTSINAALSPAISNDPRTWPDTWPDKDASWDGYWDGYFGKRPAADQESYTVMDDDYYDDPLWSSFYPDSRDSTRHGLGLRVDVRGFQWSNPESQDVIFWHYDITNEGTTDYPVSGNPENIIFGLYMDSGVGGSAISCDGIAESDDDNAYWDRSYAGLNLVYTWDLYGHGVGLGTLCAPTGYVGYAYLETPGKPYDGIDNDDDGITDESRASGPGQKIVGQGAISAYLTSHPATYNMTKFQAYYGNLLDRPAFKAGEWWTGDEDLDWVALYDDVGADGVPNTHDIGEGDGIPTAGEPDFDQTDPDESDQIGLTGFKMNRIVPGKGNPSTVTDGIIFYTDQLDWPHRLYAKFTDPTPDNRFDAAVVNNYNIAFLFASGPFTLKAGDHERFSLALAYGPDLQELRTVVTVVEAIYNANYQFSTPPPTPTLKAEVGDHYVQLTWDDVAENATNPITRINAFEGYRIYRSTDPTFLDPKTITNGLGTGTIGNGKPVAQFDIKDGRAGFTEKSVQGVAYYLGSETGLTHTWRDTNVTNGQQYYYAVCSYDWGPSIVKGTVSFTYYPSESPITVSQTLRGGLILRQNVVAVRPDPRVGGYLPAGVSAANRVTGNGFGTVGVQVVNSPQVPGDHVFRVSFTNDPDSVHAISYTLTDTTTGTLLYSTGKVFDGSPTGPIAAGVMARVYTPPTILIDSANTGFVSGSPTNAMLGATYNAAVFPINQRRFAFPANITIQFSNTIIDTAVGGFPFRALPVKFTVIGHLPTGDQKLKFQFADLNGDSTLSHVGGGNHETIHILTGPDSLLPKYRYTWDVELTGDDNTTQTPGSGDIYQLTLLTPFTTGDVFTFTTKAEVISADKAKEDFKGQPYVVPNPYVGAASFEPAPFGVQGRGDRYMEFRNLPRLATIRIYTVRGDLVRVLRQDGSTAGIVGWDLRTKDNLDVAPGLYIYHVDGDAVGKYIGKFAIIK